MGIATVLSDIAPLYERPTPESPRNDEALYGMSVQVIQESESGWCYLRTEYNTEGYTPASFLERDPNVAASWRKYRKMVVLAYYIDVYQSASFTSARLASLPRGGILVSLAPPEPDGWLKVGLANGSVGYTRASYLGDVIADWRLLSAQDMRWNLVETALSYNGAAYRAGGRTPLGIDSIGLAAMSYLINGVLIERSSFFKPGGLMKSIEFEQMDEGDLLYFRGGGIGIYMGDSKFVHATDFPGSEGVTVNSLRPKDPDYRSDLAGHIIAIASLY